MTVWIYVDTTRQVDDRDHLKVFADEDAAEKWLRITSRNVLRSSIQFRATAPKIALWEPHRHTFVFPRSLARHQVLCLPRTIHRKSPCRPQRREFCFAMRRISTGMPTHH
jgi:hypothetical protein